MFNRPRIAALIAAAAIAGAALLVGGMKADSVAPDLADKGAAP